MLDLVEIPNCWFSHAKAQIVSMVVQAQFVKQV